MYILDADTVVSMWNLLRDYESFLLNNASQISSIEGSLRSFTYILPGRFHDAELASESRECCRRAERAPPNAAVGSVCFPEPCRSLP